MRIRRTPYLLVFLLAGFVAAAAYAAAQPRVEVVRATVDLPVLTEIRSDMVESVRVSPADVPAEAARSVDEVVGRYAALPILAGQFVDRRALERTPGERALGLGAPLPAGQVAFALPVEPGQAVGAALAPGAHVTIIAVPNALAGGLSPEPGATPPAARILAADAVVLALRTPDGRPLQSGPDPEAARGLIPPTLGSVVVAIPAERQVEFAAAAASSTFYLTLNRPAASP